jgi:hypothetical protein
MVTLLMEMRKNSEKGRAETYCPLPNQFCNVVGIIDSYVSFFLDFSKNLKAVVSIPPQKIY